jgi:hypothetical protein
VVSAYQNDERAAWFVDRFRRAAADCGTMIDCSHMAGAGDYSLHFEAVEDGRLEYVDEVIDGVQQVRFFRITERGRAWIAAVTR